ncbi:hypothetical protein PSH61_08345 [Pseudomonas rhodesiae]|uniref:hypothetical protein n=1 Tax=Pseudomonas rhodesiae TaxID=76760 RepID=UPI002732B185|nr:hypothetical protein [Pseudomonas rhodesiae]WLI31107.1 hypothetical protein PSH61_08345 [Pseudomonas rhodesiae]
MKIRITEAFSVEGTVYVKFQSLSGNATALWSGTAPKNNEILNMEIDLEDVFSWGKNIKPSNKKTPHITTINGVTQITAEMIKNQDEECSALKVNDSIILIDLEKPIAEKKGWGKWVQQESASTPQISERYSSSHHHYLPPQSYPHQKTFSGPLMATNTALQREHPGKIL